MASEAAELPAGAIAWLKARLDASELELKRLVVRREAWQADVIRRDGSRQCYFIRIDRAALAGRPGRRGLERETGLIRYLSEHTSIPTQRIVDWSDEHCIAIQSFEPGRADLDTAAAPVQRAIMQEFMGHLADMHRIDVSALDLPGFERPDSPRAHSLLELEAIERPERVAEPLDSSSLLGEFGLRWLRRHVPAEVERTCLLQGDTGAGNFMFDDTGVTAIVDWEWAHYGDPLEDLGNVWLRDFFTPSAGGDLTPFFLGYAERAGLELDKGKIVYYLVHQLVRSVISLPALTRRPHWSSPAAMNLGYQAICDELLCQALGIYHGLSPAFVPLQPREPRAAGQLHLLVAEQLERGIAPCVEGDYARSQVAGAAAIARYLERLHLDGPRADALELESISTLLGERFASLEDARAGLMRALVDEPDAVTEDAVIQHCWGVATRNLSLMEPLVSRWRDCRLARVDC